MKVKDIRRKVNIHFASSYFQHYGHYPNIKKLGYSFDTMLKDQRRLIMKEFESNYDLIPAK